MRIKIAVLLGFVLLTSAGYSQSVSEVWYGIGLSHKLSDLEIYADHQIRYGMTTNQLEKEFTVIGMEFDVNKYLDIGGEYRFGDNRRGSGDIVKFDRLSYFLKSKIEVARFEFKPRIQWQRQKTTPKKKEKITDKVRFKGQVNYDIRQWKLDPFFAAEFFTADEGEGYAKEKVRYTLGTSYKILKGLSISLGYRYETSYDIEEVDVNVIQAVLNYKF